MLARVHELAPDEADLAELGGKVLGIIRLCAASLPVPEGVVLGASHFRRHVARVKGSAHRTHAGVAAAVRKAPVDPELLSSLRALLPGIGGRFVVRSSATCEDRDASLAPGVFASVRGVRRDRLEDAVRAVWASVFEETATFYLESRGIDPHAVGMAVLVQTEINGVAGTAYTRDPSEPESDDVLLEAQTDGGRPDLGVVRRSSGELIAVPDALGPRVTARIARLGLEAEAALGGPVDIEWVAAGRKVWLVQARPQRTPAPPAPSFSDESMAFSAAEPGAVWTWDAVHNPEPLSPAQQGLVEMVDDAGVAPVRQRVVEGYLYTTTDGAPPPRDVIGLEALPGAYDTELAPAFERSLAAAREDDLETALSAYVSFYETYAGVLQPSLSAARRWLVSRLAEVVPRREAAAAAHKLLWGAALIPTGDDAEGAALLWDVAAPPRQRPAGEGSRVLAHPTEAAPDRVVRALGPWLSAVQRVAAIAEQDDAWFARAQAAVRGALLGWAGASGLSPVDDVFYLPLSEVRKAAREGTRVADAASRARSLREEIVRRRGLRAPLCIVAGRAVHRPAHEIAGVLRGRGAGGRVRGTVAHLRSEPTPSGAVAVAPTFTPQMLPLISAASAVVSAHGGLLDHAAALARERGIPCVVGCAGAETLLDGETVLVDGAAGVVVRLVGR